MSDASGTEGDGPAFIEPTRPALVLRDRIVAFGVLERRINQLARAFRAGGLQQGDRLALLTRNRAEWVETYLAASRTGLVLVPVNWHLPATDMAYVVADSGARAIVAEDAFADVFDASSSVTLRLVVGDQRDGWTPYEDAIRGLDGSALAEPGHGSLMIYTSGTTGRPKGVVHRQTAGAVATGAAMVALFGLEADRGDQMLCTAPLYHSGPSRICCEWPLGAGVPVVLMDRFDPEEALALIDERRITHAFFVPTMFQRLLALPGEVRNRYDVSSLRFVLHGAGPCSVKTKHAIMGWFGPVVHEMYASSEGPGTWITPQEWLAHPGSVGRVSDDRIAIRGEDGAPAPAETNGTVWFRAGSTRFRYHNDPDRTASTYDSTGDWFTVGDHGWLDADGYLYLTGRSADLIVRGGVNLYPARIDEALLDHPEVADVAAVGVPDDEYGEIVHAAIVASNPTTAGPQLAERIIGYCRSALGRQMTPTAVHFVDELPRSDAGKLYRRVLRDQLTSRKTRPTNDGRTVNGHHQP